MNLTKTEWRLWVVFCNLLVVLAGLFAIYYIECKINMDSRDLAKSAAEELAGNTNPDTGLQDPDQYLTYSVYLENQDGLHPVRIYYGQRDNQFPQVLQSYHRFLEEKKAFYTVHVSLSPLEMVSIAGNPVVREHGDTEIVYVVKSLEYAMGLCLFYACCSTLIYGLIVYVIQTQKRSRERIEQIYHQYIANISHELKSPIASISAITETLSEGLVEDELTTSRYYGIILRESKLLEHSVMQIIALSKLQDQTRTFDRKIVPAHEVFDPISERFTARCEEIGIDFALADSIRDLPDLYTDPFRLTQLLEILLENACKFVSDDGHIFLDATTKYGQATIRVNDDGRGISEEDMPHIFERFYKTNVDNPTGTGLGLAIAREIVRGLDEDIWVQSKEGEGTIFFVTVSTKS